VLEVLAEVDAPDDDDGVVDPVEALEEELLCAMVILELVAGEELAVLERLTLLVEALVDVNALLDELALFDTAALVDELALLNEPTLLEELALLDEDEPDDWLVELELEDEGELGVDVVEAEDD
jgi:hypothetical protein